LYDALNRLLDASHYDHVTANTWAANSNAYQENLTYDKNGNINTLLRRGPAGVVIDNLGYNYSGNQLNYVSDSGDPLKGFVNGNTSLDDYSYDFNGNLDKDKNKGLNTKGNIQYNYLNLPKLITKGTETLAYAYDATGRKLAQVLASSTNKTTDYIGELVYENNVLQFINHAEGRVIPTGNEYQYHLKDHLGNVRLTFTTRAQTITSYTANLETGTTGSGEGVFNNYTATTFDLVDHTDAAGTTHTKVQLLNGGASGRVGLAKSLAVMPGDQISVSAYAKYMNLTTNANGTSLITALASAFGVSSASTGEQGKIYSGLNSYSTAVGSHPNDDQSQPKAFVTILIFDGEYNLLDATWDQIGAVGAQTSGSVKQPPHDLLSATYTAKQGGYAYLFVSNEHSTYVDVYFDDVSVTHSPSAIVGMDDYYPFGLTYKSHQRETGIANAYRYNGKETQDELGLAWLDFGARMYMSDLGRWGVIDPQAELLEMSSPFVYSLNSPINFLDPDGELPIFINGRVWSNSQRGDPSYWDAELLNTVKNSGIPNQGATDTDWALFVDGDRYASNFYANDGMPLVSKGGLSPGVLARERHNGGYFQAKRDFQKILAKLERDPESKKIIEKIQIYSHSRGGAFATGYTEGLLEMIKSHGSEFQDPSDVIEFVLHMAPHQSDFVHANKGVDEYSIDHSRDKLSDNDMTGVKAAFTTSEKSSGFFGAHSTTSFAKDVKGFTQAILTSKKENKNIVSMFVNYMQNNYGVKVTVKK
jgi:RHS repeat-associated protein